MLSQLQEKRQLPVVCNSLLLLIFIYTFALISYMIYYSYLGLYVTITMKEIKYIRIMNNLNPKKIK